MSCGEISILYLLTTASGETYIGFTRKSLAHREALHRAKAYRKVPSQLVHETIRKEGHQFSMRALCIGELPYIRRLEERAIEKFKPSLNVNVGSKPTAKTIAAIKTANTGRKHSDEWKVKQSVALKGNKNRLGIPHSEEACEKMKGRVPWNKGRKGRVDLVDPRVTRARQSLAQATRQAKKHEILFSNWSPK